MTKRVFMGATLLLTGLVMVFQVAWALSLPGFRGPDEPHHVNSILRLASGGGWPVPGEAMLDPVVVQAGRESGIIVEQADSFVGMSRTRLENSGVEQRSEPPLYTFFAEREVVPEGERSAIGPVEMADPEAVEIDQMSQHPPVYYAGGAALVSVFDLEEQPWDRMLTVLRLYGILLTAPVVPALVYTARRLGVRRTWALAAGFLPFAIPQYFAITGGVTNDSMAIGTGALVVAALAKAGTEPISRKTVLLAGGSLGLALWSKGLLLALGLALILVFMLKRDESWRRRIIATGTSGVLALAIGWWWILNVVRYGVIQPSGFHRSPGAEWDPALAEPARFLSSALRSIATSFFSSFGWLEAKFPSDLTFLLSSALIVAVIWGVIVAGKHRRTAVAILSPVGGLVLVLLAESWSTYVETGMIAGVQGRYLFPMIAALSVIILGLQSRRGITLVIFAAITVTVGAYGYVYFLESLYPGEDTRIDLERFSEVTGLSSRTTTVLMTGVVIVLVAALVLAAIVARIESRFDLSKDEAKVRPLLGEGLFRPRRETTPGSDEADSNTPVSVGVETSEAQEGPALNGDAKPRHTSTGDAVHDSSVGGR